ncbi:MAG: integrin alpha [Cyanobacteria bacterium J06592_8]
MTTGFSMSFGRSVSGAGDINGDGTDEIIIGSPGNSSFNNIGSYVVFGNDQGFNARLDVVFDLNDSNGFGIAGIDAVDLGRSVSGAGDINGDGIDDIIIGASNASSNDNNLYEGQSYVVFGSNQGFDTPFFNGITGIEVADLNGSNGFVINGIDENDGSGGSVSGAGDVNGDD